MEPTAQKPNPPAAAAKPGATAAGPKSAAPALTSPESRSRRPIVVMAIMGVLFGTVIAVMFSFAPPPPATASAKAPAAKSATADPVGGSDGINGNAATSSSANAASTARTARPAPDRGSSRPGPPSAAPAVLREPAAPKWTGGLQNAWSKRPSAAYELIAENQVALLAKRVRPVLTVRCESGRTEVFVLTESAAVIEGDDGRHTVRVGFDGANDVTQRWLASADYDALFAPDAVRLAQQIAASRTMRFGFAPYGAAPVVAQFEVGGFDGFIGTIAKACRWK